MKKYERVSLLLVISLFSLLTINMAQAKNLGADVVVIGCGSSGLVAGLTARYGGASVIIFEKMPFHGGTSQFAEGMFAVESSLQIQKNIGLTKDEAFKRHMENTHWRANARLVRAFIDKSASTIDWLQQQGVEFIEPAALFPDGPRTWHLMKGGGVALVNTLFEKSKEKGVQIYLETPVKKIEVDKKNRTFSITAEDKKGNVLRANAKAVIMSAGGFTSNKEMVQKYVEGGSFAIPVVDLAQTGGPIQMAWAIGATPEGTSVVMSIPAVPGEKPDSQLWAAGAQPYLWINQGGERFCDESIIFRFPYAGNALAKQKGGVMYSIFDEETKKYMIEKGIQYGLGVFVPVTTKLGRLDPEIQRGVKEGKAFVASSLEELATKINVSGKILKGTIDENNKICEKHHDDLFAKDSRYLRPVKKERFYAVKSTFHIFTTLGGIKINHKTEALDKDDEVIPGVYAIGNCAGGLYGETYEVLTTGGSLGFAVNSGRIAGENVLKYIGK